jgi:purine-binding chemotaxis protein CheW
VLTLVFSLGPEAYALPLRQVREVVQGPALTVLPTAPPSVLGLLNLRSDVLPVLDTSMLVGSPFPAPPRYVVVVETASGPVGLASDGRPRIVELGVASGQEHAQERAEPAAGLHTVDGGPVLLLDVRTLVRLVPAEA